jgi:hypothetical protein
LARLPLTPPFFATIRRSLPSPYRQAPVDRELSESGGGSAIGRLASTSAD